MEEAYFCSLTTNILSFCLCKVVFTKPGIGWTPAALITNQILHLFALLSFGKEEVLLIAVLMFISGIHFWMKKLLCQRSAMSELYGRVISSENRRLSYSRWSGNRFLTLSESAAHPSVLFPCSIHLSYLKVSPMKENHHVALFVKQLCPETW